MLDIGVEYDEDISHVKYTTLQLLRECPYIIESPEPRVLLNELGEYAKIFRMYAWVEDYSDEFVAKDWLFKNIAERFEAEGIGIPFPTAVEIGATHKESYNKQRKATNVRRARLQMIKEDKASSESVPRPSGKSRPSRRNSRTPNWAAASAKAWRILCENSTVC